MKPEIAPMSPRRRGWQLLGSAALGSAGLMLVLVTFIVLQDKQDIRPVSMVAYCAFFAAAFCSPRRNSAFDWIKMISVVLGGILPALALKVAGAAFTDDFYAVLLAATAIGAAFIGSTSRVLISRQRYVLAATVGCAAFVVASAAELGLVPRLFDRLAYADVDRLIEPFSVRTLDGEAISSDTWRGRVVVVSYWATWCPPCLSEIPQIAALQRKYQNDSRVAIVALNAAYGGDTAPKARDFLARRHFDIATEIDDIRTAGRAKGEGAIQLGLQVVPTLFILNKDLRLVAVHVGYDSSEHLVATLSSRIDYLATSAP